MSFITPRNVAGAFVSPNGMTKSLYGHHVCEMQFCAHHLSLSEHGFDDIPISNPILKTILPHITCLIVHQSLEWCTFIPDRNLFKRTVSMFHLFFGPVKLVKKMG